MAPEFGVTSERYSQILGKIQLPAASPIGAVVQIGIQLGVALPQTQLLQQTQQQAVVLELSLDE